MANQINTNTGVIQKAMAAGMAEQGSPFKDNASKVYKDAYKKDINGYEGGDSFNIAKEAIYDAIDGMVEGTDISALGAEFKEEKFSVTVNSNPIVVPKFTDKELTFELDRSSTDGLKRLTKPVSRGLNVKSEKNGARIYAESADNAIIVDTAPSNFKNLFGDMKIRLIETGIDGDIMSIIDERMMVTLARELEEKFNPVKGVNDAFDGKFYSYNDIKFTKSLHISKHVNGAGGDTLTLGADYVEGATTLQLSAIGDVVVGDKIDLGVAQVNQFSKDVLGFNAIRVVKAISGNVITITPIYFADSSRQNVDATGFAAADTMDVLGTKGSSYSVYPIYNKDAWAYVNVDQPALDGNDKVGMAPIKGMQTRYYSWSNGDTAVIKQRAETLEAWFAVRSEFCGTLEVKVGLI